MNGFVQKGFLTIPEATLRLADPSQSDREVALKEAREQLHQGAVRRLGQICHTDANGRAPGSSTRHLALIQFFELDCRWRGVRPGWDSIADAVRPIRPWATR